MTRRRGFTLVELVVVVLILGIVAAVAAPRVVGTSRQAEEASLRRSLALFRDSVETHRARNGGRLPGEAGTEADLKADLAPYLRKFPANAVKKSGTVAVQTTGVPFTGTVGGGSGWRYDNVSGEVVANSNGTASDGRRYYQW